MLDADEISVPAIPSGKRYSPVRYRDNRTPLRGAVVGCQMRPFGSEDWMHTPCSKSRRHPGRKFQRRGQNGALQRNAFFIIEAILEEKAPITAPGIHKLCGLNPAVFDEISFVERLI